MAVSSVLRSVRVHTRIVVMMYKQGALFISNPLNGFNVTLTYIRGARHML